MGGRVTLVHKLETIFITVSVIEVVSFLKVATEYIVELNSSFNII